MTALIPSLDEISTYERYAKLQATGFFPKAIDTPQKAMLIMLKGRELGIPPLQAIEDLMVVDGKVTQSGKLMLARIYQRYPEAQIFADVKTDTQCAVIASRSKGSKSEAFSFSLDDAKKAGLLGKRNWQQYPKNMLYWRVIANVAREMFPDTLMGVNYTPEELGCETTEDGEVVDIEEVPKTAAQPKAPDVNRLERAEEASEGDDGGRPGKAPSRDTSPERADSPEEDTARHTSTYVRAEGVSVERASQSEEPAPEPATLSPVYNGKTAPEKKLFKEMAFKFGIVTKEDLVKVSKECVGLQMDAIPARINELLEMGDFGL
jgi:hypothetical protein